MNIYKSLFSLAIILLLLSVITYADDFVKLSVDNNKVYKNNKELVIPVDISIKDGYHIGAFENVSDLYPTSLELDGFSAEIDFPKTQKYKLNFSTDYINGYNGDITIFCKVNTYNISTNKLNSEITLRYQACDNNSCFMPSTAVYNLKIDNLSSVRYDNPNGVGITKNITSERLKSVFNGNNLAVKILIVFLFGVIVSFTPCVYPMIPITVGYFASQSKRNVFLLAFLYVIGIAFTYSVFGVFASLSGHALGSQLSNPAVNYFIAGLLLLLAISMFGYFDFSVPKFISNRAIGQQGTLGAFVMGILFGIVAAPCAAPPVIFLAAYVAKLADPFVGFLLFFTFAMGLGLLLFFVAALSAKIPKPGEWMVMVKKICGIIFLIAASFYLSQLFSPPFNDYLVPLTMLFCSVSLFFVSGVAFGAKRNISMISAVLIILIGSVMFYGVLKDNDKKTDILFEDYSTARFNAAVQDEKPIMLFFTAKWCDYCQKLKKGPFREEKVAESAKGIALFTVDMTDESIQENVRLSERYNVLGYPTLVFISADGKEVSEARINGFVKSDEIIKSLKIIKE